MIHNEDSRVKIPALLHLTRLGYTYLSLKNSNWDPETNIFPELFQKAIRQINPNIETNDIDRIYSEISLALENEDLGKAFYEKLIDDSGIRLIDFENFEKNHFHVVTELTYKNGEEEFRPDITLLINGMPLIFIEVKKPNNRNGVLEERRRINRRFQNKKFRKFVNITQMMIFSNNMEYDSDSTAPIEGAFYASPSYDKPIFNYFREEIDLNLAELLSPLDENIENEVLLDNNLLSIKTTAEFRTNKEPDTPTNRLSNSLLNKERLAFILKYSIAYVKERKGIEKHIMRYPQIFATKAIKDKLDKGVKNGIIWHTQGSGKTALAYYNVKYLTDYYRKKKVVPKFYFIVDRLDLLIQAGKEFRSRGLVVHKINSREEFSKEIKSTKVLHNDSGKAEITVVNIQRFENDPDVIRNTDYQLGIQRIYFLDEVHRSYNPKGSFLANLRESDPNSIKIGLTGTPLLGDDYNSKQLFGGYIHKYYYNASIADGYTLRLIREEIETSYKLALKKTLEEIEILKGDADKKFVYAHHKFVEPMLDYIVQDFEKARVSMNDDSIGGMVICDSSEQAKMMYEIFQEKYAENDYSNQSQVAEPVITYSSIKKLKKKVKTAAVILHDVGTKQERKDLIDDFKEGDIDFLFVFKMLLTGFDAKRLKKLYVGRVIKSHNLLQALTRVNRTYKDFKYGYVVDFADIKSEFDKTNRDYFKELQSELGDEIEHYTSLFKSEEEIIKEIDEIKKILFHYETRNAEVFSNQISQINDRNEILKITKALNNSKSLYNLIRLSGNYELLEKLDFNKLSDLSKQANDRLAMINTKEALENGVDTSGILKEALEDVYFAFRKVGQGEMIIADKLKDSLRKTRESLRQNFDPGDPQFINLKDELERLFKKKKLNEVTSEEMEENIKELEKIYNKARELERKNQLLRAKYDNDEKYARLHKRLMEKDPLTNSEAKLFEALQGLKKEVDSQILKNSKMLENESFVERMIMRLVIDQFRKKNDIPLDSNSTRRINGLLVNEYMNEFYGRPN